MVVWSRLTAKADFAKTEMLSPGEAVGGGGGVQVTPCQVPASWARPDGAASWARAYFSCTPWSAASPPAACRGHCSAATKKP